VLIVLLGHDQLMAALVFLIAVIGVCVLAARYGVDSRPVERDRHRPNL
jgi:hypothetical protein